MMQQPSPLPKETDLPLTPLTPLNQSPARVQVNPCSLDALDLPFLSKPMPTTPTMPTHPTQPLHQPDLLPTPQAPFSNLQNTAEKSQPYNLAVLQHQTMTQQHHMKLLMMTMPTTLTPPMIMINTSLVTKAILLCHHKTLDHLKANIQWLSHSMVKLNAVIDCINHLLQPTTKTRLITSNLTHNQTSPSLIPSPAKTTHSQQSPASASLSSIQTPCVPPKPPNLTTTHNSCPYSPSDNQLMANTPPAAAKWPQKTHHPITTLPVLTKYTVACMRYQPHPCPSFLTMLLCMAKNNYQPP